MFNESWHLIFEVSFLSDVFFYCLKTDIVEDKYRSIEPIPRLFLFTREVLFEKSNSQYFHFYNADYCCAGGTFDKATDSDRKNSN